MKFWMLLLSLTYTLAVFAQTTPSCCNLTATTEFAMLTVDDNFINSHQEPQPTTVPDDIGRMITFKTEDGTPGRAFEILTPYQTNSYLFIFQEWWGLNDHIKNEAIKYFKELRDVNVIAIDLYDGKVATTREEASKLMQGADEERIRTIIEGAIKYVGKQANIATLGWCFGGGWSLQASMMVKEKQQTGAIMYYGMPEKDMTKLQENLHCDVLFMFAQQDDWISAKVLSEFENKMEQLPQQLFVEKYNAPHAFANPSNPGYNKAYTEDAFKNSIKFLRKRYYLKGG